MKTKNIAILIMSIGLSVSSLSVLAADTTQAPNSTTLSSQPANQQINGGGAINTQQGASANSGQQLQQGQQPKSPQLQNGKPMMQGQQGMQNNGDTFKQGTQLNPAGLHQPDANGQMQPVPKGQAAGTVLNDPSGQAQDQGMNTTKQGDNNDPKSQSGDTDKQ